MIAIATVLGLSAAFSGVYFLTLGRLYLSVILWLVFAGPLLGYALKNSGLIREERADPHCKRDDGYCVHCHQPWPCTSSRTV